MTRRISGPQLARLLESWRTSLPSGPSYERLAASVRAVLLDGRLPAGVRVPAERDLSAHLDVSRSTVTAAYDRLREDGYLRSKRGSGSWTELPAGRVRVGNTWSPALRTSEREDTIDLAVAAPEAAADPVSEAATRAAESLPGYLHGHGYDPCGLTPLRTAVAEGYTAAGLDTRAEQILITTGAQGAIDVIARTLLDPRDAVLVESPTYPNALESFRYARARLVPAGMTEHGWDLDLITSALGQALPKLGYLMPDFHNPTGHLLDGDGRARLVRAARRSGTHLVCDESMAALDLRPETPPAAPLPHLAAYDTDGRILSVGSMSKSFWGGLRVGWIRASPPLIARLAEARGPIDMAPPVLEQLVAMELLADSERLLAHRRASLASRRDTLVAALRQELPEWEFTVPRGGLSLWVTLDGPISTALSLTAERHGVRVPAGPRFGVDGAMERFLRIPFTLPETESREAVRRLRTARGELTGVSEVGPRPAVA